MKILKGSITSLASQGYITLQIPVYDVWIDKEPKQSKTEDIPDDWVITLKGGQRRPVIGKEKGFLFLSKIGWDANWKKIRQTYLDSGSPRGTWADFEEHVEEHFQEVIKSTKKKIIYEEKRVEELKEVLKKL